MRGYEVRKNEVVTMRCWGGGRCTRGTEACERPNVPLYRSP